MEESGTGGIVNVGFTCYANSVIQAFRHYKNIVELLHEDNYTTILKDGCKYNGLTKQFANMIQTLSTISKNSSIRPSGFWHELNSAVEDTCFEDLRSRRPHDAHEFLMFILDALHESLARKVTMNISKVELKSEKQKLQQKSLETWKEQFEKVYSPLVNMFFGLHHVQIICECKNVTNKFETFNTLEGTFNDNNKITLIESLLNNLNDEIIEGYNCEKCNQKTNALKKRKIWRLPKNLIIILKRFTYDGRKINTPIELGALDLNNIYSNESPYKNNSEYSLLALVDHHGSISGGHYTAQGIRLNNKWFQYDDQNVHDLENPHIGESTYILFLEAK